MGGRFSGLFDGYNPQEDPDNFETCIQCNGTGKRLVLPEPIEVSSMEDGECVSKLDYSRTTREYMESLGGCNGCGGKGTHLKPPSEWKTYTGDSIPLAELTAGQYQGRFNAVCISCRGWFNSELWVPWAAEEKRKVRLELPPLEWLKANGWEGDLAVVVDCHI